MVLAVQARATAKGYGALNARARVNRLTGGLSLGLEMPAFPLGEVAAAVARSSLRDVPIEDVMQTVRRVLFVASAEGPAELVAAADLVVPSPAELADLLQLL